MMSLDEYRKWLEENANQEEAMAYEVAKEVIRYHSMWKDDVEARLYPRKVFQNKKEKLEFDLVIEIEWESEGWKVTRKIKRTIGVEFKETDIDKVIKQAIARRDYVHYMYIATKPATLMPQQLFLLADYGIGWVVWKKDEFANLVLGSRFERNADITTLLDYFARKSVEKAIKEIQEESKVTRALSLLDFTGVES